MARFSNADQSSIPKKKSLLFATLCSFYMLLNPTCSEFILDFVSIFTWNFSLCFSLSFVLSLASISSKFWPH